MRKVIIVNALQYSVGNTFRNLIIHQDPTMEQDKHNYSIQGTKLVLLVWLWDYDLYYSSTIEIIDAVIVSEEKDKKQDERKMEGNFLL